MHLPNYPQYFVKGDRRRAVYYTADATALLAMGWVREDKEAPAPKPEPTPASVEPAAAAAPVVQAEEVEVEVVEDDEPEIEEPGEEAELPDFEFMTKGELIKFAAECGETLQPTLLKADLIEACKKLVRARDSRGRFLGDDPSTPDVNEAWTLG